MDLGKLSVVKAFSNDLNGTKHVTTDIFSVPFATYSSSVAYLARGGSQGLQTKVTQLTATIVGQAYLAIRRFSGL